MIDFAPLLAQYGVLGIWTIVLLLEKKEQKKIEKEERAEHVQIIKSVSTNMALVNDNLKELKTVVSNCPRN